MTSTTADVLVVGAGLAGATAAGVVAAAGRDVIALDKGRGPGGRLSTRRVDDRRFDHGAAAVQASGDFHDWLCDAALAGASAPFDGDWVGVPGMNALVLRALGGVEPVWGATVAALRRSEGRWVAEDAEGGTLAAGRSAVLAVPPAQAIALLRTAVDDIDPAAGGLRRVCDALSAAHHAPVWVGLVSLAPDTASRLRQDVPTGIWAPASETLACVRLDDAKPGRAPTGQLVVHARVDWSLRHLESSAEQIADPLRDALLKAVGLDPEAVLSVQAHRWRYALPEQGCPLDGEDGLRLALAGDAIGWTIEAGVSPAEQAWRSGRAAAARALSWTAP